MTDHPSARVVSGPGDGGRGGRQRDRAMSLPDVTVADPRVSSIGGTGGKREVSGSQRTFPPIEQNRGEPASLPPVPLKGRDRLGRRGSDGRTVSVPPVPRSLHRPGCCGCRSRRLAGADSPVWCDGIPQHRYWLDDHLFPVSITGVLAGGQVQLRPRPHRGQPCRLGAARQHLSPGPGASFLTGRFRPGVSAPSDEHGPGNTPSGAEVDFDAYREWIEPLDRPRALEAVEVIASERPTCCLVRNVAGTYDTAYIDPHLSRRG